MLFLSILNRIIAGIVICTLEYAMSDENQDYDEDAMTDAVSAIVLVLIPVITIIYWLSGMPTS